MSAAVFDFARLRSAGRHAREIESATDWRNRLSAIRHYYATLMPEIMAAPANRWAYDVYEVDWLRVFTPIEAWMWSDIREVGIVLYPQCPIVVRDAGGTEKTFFPDFSHPLRKIAVECDGKDFHRDWRRDQVRDDLLAANGWTVERFTGAECRRESDDANSWRGSVQQRLRALGKSASPGGVL